ASYALRVPQVGVTPAASFRRRLATTPLRFGSRFSPSQPAEDLHLLVTSRLTFAHRFNKPCHARHTAIENAGEDRRKELSHQPIATSGGHGTRMRVRFARSCYSRTSCT